MQLTGSIKGADCLRFPTDAGQYWFHETLPPQQQRTWEDGLRLLKNLLHATCDADDPEAIPTLKALKLDTSGPCADGRRMSPAHRH